jgi:prepilin-type N-terminal cleavage/methylation domain-containing protein
MQRKRTRASVHVPIRHASALKTRESGFTILELLVVLLLFGLTLAIIVPSFSAIASTKTREDAFKLSVMVQYLYERAITDGTPYRLLIDIESNETSIERVIEGRGCGEGLPLLETATTRFTKLAKKAEESRRKKIEAGELEDTEAQVEQVREGIQNLKNMALDSQTQFYGMATQSNPNLSREGVLSIYFYPHGYVEKALLIVESNTDSDIQFSLVTEPLRGTARVVPGVLDADEVFD